MEKINSQIFEMYAGILRYDGDKSILLCKAADGNKNLWVKKLHDVSLVEAVAEDGDRYYISCESADIRGFFLALSKGTGETEWFIPGKAYLQVIFDGYLYAIFSDERKRFYLIKVERTDGNKIWHHEIGGDLCEYRFRRDRITLTYGSGRLEHISPATGIIVN